MTYRTQRGATCLVLESQLILFLRFSFARFKLHSKPDPSSFSALAHEGLEDTFDALRRSGQSILSKLHTHTHFRKIDTLLDYGLSQLSFNQTYRGSGCAGTSHHLAT